jgi:hypothetical protein
LRLVAKRILIVGVRIVNHEVQRTAVLTFRLFFKWKPDAPAGEGPDETVAGVFSGEHPEGSNQRALQMPINVVAGSSASGDILFEIDLWRDYIEEAPSRLEIEDHRSGAKVSMSPGLGGYGVRDP